jgi:RNA-directed DNA polymerase
VIENAGKRTPGVD